MPRPRVDIVNVKILDNIFHCGSCCTSDHQLCDCELERIPMYVQYMHTGHAKGYALECITCGAINKTGGNLIKGFRQ